MTHFVQYTMEERVHWRPPPSDISDVPLSIWIISAGQCSTPGLEYFERLLDSSEKRRAAGFRLEQDKNRFTVGRGYLKHLLSVYYGIPLYAMQIERGISGKPRLSTHQHLKFNISHSHEWIAIAIADDEVGIDLEWINPAFSYEELLENCLTCDETRAIRSSPFPVSEFYKLWTRKEAFLKGIGSGIDDNMNKLNCLDGSHIVSNQYFAIKENWHIGSFQVEEQYMVSVATANLRHNLSLFKSAF